MPGAGSIGTLPVLMGSNRDEGGMFIKLPKNATQAQYEAYVTGWTDAETLQASSAPDIDFHTDSHTKCMGQLDI
jgi:hypothetical protein